MLICILYQRYLWYGKEIPATKRSTATKGTMAMFSTVSWVTYGRKAKICSIVLQFINVFLLIHFYYLSIYYASLNFLGHIYDGKTMLTIYRFISTVKVLCTYPRLDISNQSNLSIYQFILFIINQNLQLPPRRVSELPGSTWTKICQNLIFFHTTFSFTWDLRLKYKNPQWQFCNLWFG